MSLVIGVLGGMGTYATINLFQQYAEVFPAKKEWERPRIIIDNRCTMPSRVKAFLYNEEKDQLLDEMADSIEMLIKCGCNKILLSCNTAHIFLPELCNRIPQLEKKLVNIIDLCAEKLEEDMINTVCLLGTEGTIESRVYDNLLNKKGINCITPEKEEYRKIRDCIEAVKQNIYTDDIKEKFLNLINKSSACILGCTELPILLEKYKNEIICKSIYDPINIALRKIHDENLA